MKLALALPLVVDLLRGLGGRARLACMIKTVTGTQQRDGVVGRIKFWIVMERGREKMSGLRNSRQQVAA